MITREQFQEKINSFGYTPEQVQLCLAYYDNDSKSESKPNVIDNYNAEDLWKTVNRWNGIKNSSKEKKPRAKKIDWQTKIDELNEIVDSFIACNNEDVLFDLNDALTPIIIKINNYEDERKKQYLQEKKEIEKVINEFNKKHNAKYYLGYKNEEEQEEVEE